MSTRAIVQFTDGEDAGTFFGVYKHADGCPKWIGEMLKLALQYAWPLPRFEANEFAAAFAAACKADLKQVYDEANQRAIQEGNEPYFETAGGSVRIVPRTDALGWQWAGDIRFRYLVECRDHQLIVTAWAVSERGAFNGPAEWHEAKIYRGDIEGLVLVDEDKVKVRWRRCKPKPAKPKPRAMAPRLVRI